MLDAAVAAAQQLVVSDVYRAGARQVALALCGGCNAGRQLARTWSGLPPEADAVRLDNDRLVALDDPDYDQALAAIADLIRQPRGWLTLAGGYGTGKTTLIYAALNHLADRGIYGRYTTAPELLDSLRDGLAPGVETAGSRLSRLAAVPVLAVDELDKYSATAFAEEQIFKLFHRRYQQRATHATLLGYNLDGADRVPPFLASRIRDGRFWYVELRGADMRPVLGRLDPWDRGDDDAP
jgi:DNA replication protein DnaC